MIQILTKVYEGADLSGETNGVIYFPLPFESRIQAIKVKTDEAVAGDVEFVLTELDDSPITGTGLTIETGEKKAILTGLEIDRGDDADLLLKLVSGSVSSPVTLVLTIDDLTADDTPSQLDDLIDVALDAPQTGDALKFDGANWVNSPITNGADGADGSVWFDGAGAPDSGTGANGDYYLRTSNGDVYEKSAGAWAVVGNIKGPTGGAGSVGATGATGPTGATGATGGSGSNGTNGTNGANGQGVPTGGTAGQVLGKNSSTDFDASWIDRILSAVVSGVSAGWSRLVSNLEIRKTTPVISLGESATDGTNQTRWTIIDDVMYLSVNAYWDGTNWQRYNSANPSWQIQMSSAAGGDFRIKYSAAATGAITWISIFRQTSTTFTEGGIIAATGAIKPGAAGIIFSDNSAQTTAATTVTSLPLTGDVSGTTGVNTVDKIKGRVVDPTAPTDGQVYKWDAASSKWIPATVSGGGGEANTASNVGTGANVFKAKTGVDLAFRKINARAGIIVTENAGDISIALDPNGIPDQGVTEYVVWQGKTNVTQSSTNSLTKTSGTDGSFDAGAYSQQEFIITDNIRVEATLNALSSYFMLALSNKTDAEADTDYHSMDYGLYVYGNVDLYSNENGVLTSLATTVAAGDKIGVQIINGIVGYLKNGVVIATREAPTLTYPVKVDFSINALNGIVDNFVITRYSSTLNETSSKWYAINVQGLTSSPVDAQTVYFGWLPKAPVTAAATSRMHVRRNGYIRAANIVCNSGTAGTAESWSVYIRKNNTTDYLIATLASSAAERIFYNDALNIPVVAGDYLEIKSVNPTWATNPLTSIWGGYLLIQ